MSNDEQIKDDLDSADARTKVRIAFDRAADIYLKLSGDQQERISSLLLNYGIELPILVVRDE